MFHARMLAAIDGARTLANMDELSKTIWQAHSGGAVDDDGAQSLAEALHTRRAALRETVAPVGIPAGRVSLFPPRRRQRSPDLIESRDRRRRLAASGPMPPALAARFTTGQLAVLRVVVDEITEKGSCCLAIDAIGARAGVSGRWAQITLRLAEGDGLLAIQERPRQGRKSDPSIISLISHEWRQWLRKRSKSRPAGGAASATAHRVNFASPHGYESYILTSADTQNPKKGCREPAGDATTRDQSGIGAAGGSRRAMR